VHTEVHDPALPATEMNTPTPGSKAAASPNWPRALVLMDLALSLPAEQRETWLADTARQEPDLAPLLRKLLAAHARVETHEILATLPKVQRDLRAADSGAAGLRVGPFELIEPLGRGGMGSVWRARYADGRLKRDVAVKLPASSDDTTVLTTLRERFARERDFLAQLQHPNIARLYDAGISEQGQPYLAMEYVAGQPIDDYCDAQRLNVKARLRLFLQVLDAVGYAHQQLVLHRDLKPGNVLVDAQGQVRLLDFDVARLLPPEDGTAPRADDPLRTGGTDLTERAGAAFTLGYAAPEQISKGALSTATDVYALGVMLYRLLTGLSPYQPARDSRGALEDAVLLATPAQSSSRTFTADALLARQTNAAGLKRALANDLDVIIGKALKKSAAERYPSINALADDVRRHLAQLPIGARADSWWYRTHLFVLRHRVAVAASCIAAVLLVSTTGMALWQAQVAKANEVLAAKKAAQANALQQWWIGKIAGADPEKNKNITDADRRFADSAFETAEADFSSEPETLSLVFKRLAEIYYRQGNPEKLLAVLQKRAALLKRLPSTPVDERVEAELELGQALGQSPNAVDQAQSMPHLRAAHDTAVAGKASDALVIRALTYLSDGYVVQMRYREAYNYATQAAVFAKRVLPAQDPDLAQAYVMQGLAANKAGEFELAVDVLRKAIAIFEAANGSRLVQKVSAMTLLAQVELAAGHYTIARREALAALDFARLNLGRMDGTMAPARLALVQATERMGRPDEAALLVEEWLVQDMNAKLAPWQGLANLANAVVALAKNELSRAEIALNAAESLLSSTPRLAMRATVERASLHLRSGQPERARDLLDPLLTSMRAGGQTESEAFSRGAERAGVAAMRLAASAKGKGLFDEACKRPRALLKAEHPDRVRCEAYGLLASDRLSTDEKKLALETRAKAFAESRDDQTPLMASMRSALNWLSRSNAVLAPSADFPFLN